MCQKIKYMLEINFLTYLFISDRIYYFKQGGI